MARSRNVDVNKDTSKDYKDAKCASSRKGKSSKSKKDRRYPSKDIPGKQPVEPKDKYNDYSYYIKNPELLAQATQLSFQNILGIEPIDNYEVPTIMRVLMNPSIGLTYQGSNPAFLNHPSRAGINLATLKLFNRLSMSSGRNMSYAPQDLASMIGAVSQVLAMVSYARRALGTAKVSNYRNRMFPKAMIEVQGFDYDDLMDHWSDYRTALNNEITILNQIPIIANMGYIKKSMNQYDFMFTDAETPMAQIYVYVPYSTWIIDETASPDGTVLKTLSVNPMTPTTQQFGTFLQNVLRPMVTALLESSTLNLVYADILNLAAKSSDVELYSVPIVPDDYVCLPIHSYEALLHMHNATAVGVPNLSTRSGYCTPYNDVYPDPNNNSVIYNPCFKVSDSAPDGVPHIQIIDSPTPEPDLTTKLEMTRYKSMFTNNRITIDGTLYNDYPLLTDYYVVGFQIFQNDTSTATTLTSFNDSRTGFETLHSTMTQFDWGPIFYSYSPESGTAWSKIDNVYGDLNYYTVVDSAYIERLMTIVYIGLFEM